MTYGIKTLLNKDIPWLNGSTYVSLEQMYEDAISILIL